MSRRVFIWALIAVLAVPLVPGATAQGPDVSVLVDFGDGTYLWADVTLPLANTTALRATEIANGTWGLPPLEVRWYSFGALVEDIGDRNPVYPAWWHLFVWNRTALVWDFSGVGASDLLLADGDAIAWFLAVDDPVTYSSPKPVPSPIHRDAWTSFRGDLMNSGRAHGTIPVTNRVLWDRDIGIQEIDTTPVVAYGMVFVATRNALVALDAETGQEVWRNPQVGDLLSTPAVYDGHLVLGGTDGKVHYVNAQNGTEAWSVLLEPGARSTGIASSPAVFEGRAYMGTFNETAGGKGRVVAVNLNNGTIAWAYDAPGAIHLSRPLIAAGALFVGVMGIYDGGVGYDSPFGLLRVTLDGASGSIVVPTTGPVASSPAFQSMGALGCRIFFTAKDGSLYAYDLCLDQTLAWQRSVGESVSSPAVVGNRVVVASGGLDGTGRMFAFDHEGTLVWESDTGGATQASPVTDGQLVCSATNVARGSIVCFRVSDGALAWRYTPTPHEYILGSPVVVGSTMYAPSDNGHVYAFRDSDPSSFPLLHLEAGPSPPCNLSAVCSPGFTVRGLGRGRALDAKLTVTVPAGFRMAGESEAQARFLRETVIPLAEFEPDGNETVAVGGEEVLAGYGSLNWTAKLSYVDLAGRAYSETVEASSTRTPPDAVASPWPLIGAVVGGAVVVVVGSLLWRRRRRKAKT